MKKGTCMLAAIFFSVVLCGCNSGMPDLTVEQTALISEYATHLLVKHSELSERNLLSETELEAGIVKEAEDRARKEKADAIAQTYLNAEGEMVDGADVDEEQGSEAHQTEMMSMQTIAEVLGEDKVSIDYTSYELCEAYPSVTEDEFYMAMEATAGKQLCVVKFAVCNTSGQDCEIDMFGKGDKYILRTADGESIFAQTTMLLDDLSSYRGNIAGNATEQMVLVFEVDDGITQMDSAELVIKSEMGESTTSLY